MIELTLEQKQEIFNYFEKAYSILLMADDFNFIQSTLNNLN